MEEEVGGKNNTRMDGFPVWVTAESRAFVGHPNTIVLLGFKG